MTIEHAMIFRAESVRGILADPIRKMQTRRVATPHNSLIDGHGADWHADPRQATIEDQLLMFGGDADA